MNSTDLTTRAATDCLATFVDLTRLWSNGSLIAGTLLLYFDMVFGILLILIGVITRLGMYAFQAGHNHVEPS